jgi:hypothetical protein
MKAYQAKLQTLVLLFASVFMPSIYAMDNVQEPAPEKQAAPEPIYTCEAKNYNFVGQNIVLNTEKKESDQQLFFIQNISPQDIWINHTPTHASAGASAGWSSQLLKDHWSAMALNQKEISFQCMRSHEKGDLKPVSCKMVLRICRATSPTFGKGTVGSYWIIENQNSLKDLLNQLQQRGINLAAQ